MAPSTAGLRRVQPTATARLLLESGDIEGPRVRCRGRGWGRAASFWDRWLRRAEQSGKPGERTRIAYEELWRLYVGPALGRRRLASITRADVRDVVAAAAERSAWRAVDVLKVTRMLLNRAMDEELIGRNPAARIAAPKIDQGEPWVLTPDEVEALAE